MNEQDLKKANEVQIKILNLKKYKENFNEFMKKENFVIKISHPNLGSLDLYSDLIFIPKEKIASLYYEELSKKIESLEAEFANL